MWGKKARWASGGGVGGGKAAKPKANQGGARAGGVTNPFFWQLGGHDRIGDYL